MAILFKDRVRDTTTTTGTGSLTITNSAPSGFITFNSAFGTGSDNKFYYCIDGGAEWETGIGYLSSSTVLVRDTFLASSSGSAVSFSAGTKDVFATVTAQPFGYLFSAPPKIYRALFEQSGTSDPTVTVLENTLGGTVVWSRAGTGQYHATLAGAFTVNKTFCTPHDIQELANGTTWVFHPNDVDTLYFEDLTGGDDIGSLPVTFPIPIEIRVYS